MITSCLFDDAGSVCYSLQNMRAFFAACQQRGLFAAGCGSEAFLLPSVAAGASFNWQYPTSLVVSTPRFLSAKRSAVSSLREEVAQRNPLEGVPLDSSRNKRDRGPSGTPGLPGTEIFPVGRGYVLLSTR